MLVNGKKKGTRNEHKSMQRHSNHGAYCVRAGGSLGIFDFLACYPTYCLFIQVKSNRWPGTVEMTGLRDFKTPYYGIKFIERWDDYAKEPMVREVP